MVHFTDLHISEDRTLLENAQSLLNVITNHEFFPATIVLIFSGDIAFSGTAAQYELAANFLDTLTKAVKDKSAESSIHFVLAPGNHDCDFDSDYSVRNVLLKAISYESLGDTNAVFEEVLKPQAAFWEFYSRFNSEPSDKIAYLVSVPFAETEIQFYCLNTAWMSSRKESPGTLFYPVRKVKEHLQLQAGENLRFSVFHHPPNWMNPSMIDGNNKKEMVEFLTENFCLNFLGHEHEEVSEKVEALNTGDTTYFLTGACLSCKGDSGFSLLIFDEDLKGATMRKYLSKGKMYAREGADNRLNFQHSVSATKHVKDEFLQERRAFNALIGSHLRQSADLRDIFVYPDLEPVNSENKDLENYVDSVSLLDPSTGSLWLVHGEAESGKSSLLNILFEDALTQGLTPIFLTGDQINNNETEAILKKALKETYKPSAINWDAFHQMSKTQRCLLVDNFEDKVANARNVERFIREAKVLFGKIVLTTSTDFGLIPDTYVELQQFRIYRLQPLGYEKTNRLIDKYHALRPREELQDPALLEQTKSSLLKIRSVIGNRLIPPYPFFILAILQSFEAMNADGKETSYAYCYYALLYLALTKKGGVEAEDLSIYMSYLSFLAHFMNGHQEFAISEKEFEEFHRKYSDDFVVKPFAQMSTALLTSQILKREDGYFRFSYKYLLFYLKGKYLANYSSKPEVKEEIAALFDKLHYEHNSNILIFVAHHASADDEFIDDAILAVMKPFESVTPLTLSRDDPSFSKVAEIIQTITQWS